jgi:hypothetical protein
MSRSLVLSVFLGLLFATALPEADAQDNPVNQPIGRGTIEGQVVTSEGLPVADATVYAFKLGGSPLASTNIEGKFALTNLSAGKHLIIAFKESDGFPNLVWSFYSEVYGNNGKLTVNVEENQIIRDAIIRLGPQAGRLVFAVIDARTKLPITDASVTLNHRSNPKITFESGANGLDGGFDLLIPPSTPVNIVVKAPGYITWRYVNRRAADRDEIRLLPGSSQSIIVELKRGSG